jgi:hypothetical protein
LHILPAERTFLPVVTKKPEDSKRQFNVCEQVRVRLRTGQIVDATIKAIVRRTNGVRLQVNYGKDLTALIYEWQVVENQE